MKKYKNEILEWLKVIIPTVVCVMAMRTFIFAPIAVDGVSMMPTYEDGDKVIVNKIGKSIRDLERFDIIVFEAPTGENYIKRIIGLPGDHVAYKEDVLYINGKKFDEPYLNSLQLQFSGQGDLTFDFELEELTKFTEIPDGYFFVLGDNRRKSLDSRDARVGLVSMDQIIGEANIRFYPFQDVGVIQ